MDLSGNVELSKILQLGGALLEIPIFGDILASVARKGNRFS